ncbi:hypothetical protein Y032_0002g729 [Ancylostoma ceylanicum]|uniref:Uncharacterized protein n=1 Tax=Ancylostoma ceylanicum TaxID=53326 RepID=A0A016W2V6_9BILA|nr:hypothetical protein Y032_0002g729 [Ancylostoma ceylanicum]
MLRSQEDQVRRNRIDRDEKAPTTKPHLQNWVELSLGICDSGGVDEIIVLFNSNLVIKLTHLNSYQFKSDFNDLEDVDQCRLHCLRSNIKPLRRLETFYMYLEMFYRNDFTLYKVIVGDLSAKPRRKAGELQFGTYGLQRNEHGASSQSKC